MVHHECGYRPPPTGSNARWLKTMRPCWGNVGRRSLVDIGTERPPYVVEPLADPVPREHDEPLQPEREAVPDREHAPEQVPE